MGSIKSFNSIGPVSGTAVNPLSIELEERAPFRLLDQLDNDLALVLVQTMFKSGSHDALAMLGQVSHFWRGYVKAEHPFIKHAFKKFSYEPDLHWSLHRSFETIIHSNSPRFLARFIIEAQEVDKTEVTAVINARSMDTITPLMLSARLGFEQVSDVLMHFGARLTKTDPVGRNAVHWAFEGKHDRLAERFIGDLVEADSFADIRGLPSRAQLTDVTLDQASEKGHTLLMRELLEAKKGEAQVAHLLSAAQNIMAVPMMQLLIKHKPTLIGQIEGATLRAIRSQQDPTAWLGIVIHTDGHNLNHATILHALATEGKVKAFKYLFDPESDSINQEDDKSETFLWKAAHAGRPALVSYLLDNGADHLRAPNDGNALRYALGAMGRYVPRYEGADPDLDAEEISPGHAAVAKRLVQLNWPKGVLDSALDAAIDKGRVMGIDNKFGTGSAVLPDIIAALKAKGATERPVAVQVPAMKQKKQKKPNVFKRMFRHR